MIKGNKNYITTKEMLKFLKSFIFKKEMPIKITVNEENFDDYDFGFGINYDEEKISSIEIKISKK